MKLDDDSVSTILYVFILVLVSVIAFGTIDSMQKTQEICRREFHGHGVYVISIHGNWCCDRRESFCGEPTIKGKLNP